MLKNIRNKIKHILGNETNSSILTLLSGSTLSSLIALAMLPVITRIYSPETLGVFYFAVSLSLTISPAIAFRYEMAVVLSKARTAANNVWFLSLFLITINTLFLSLLVLLSTLLDYKLLGQSSSIIAIAVIFTFLNGVTLLNQQMLASFADFSRIAQNNLAKTASYSILAVILGYLSNSFEMLALAHATAMVLVIYLALKGKWKLINVRISRLRIKYAAKRFDKFPKINTLSVFLNNLSLYLPVFMITKFFTLEDVGFFMLATRIVEVPYRVLMDSFRGVYYKHASHAFHANELKASYLSMLKKLIIVGLPVTLGLFVFSELLIVTLFSEEWKRAIPFIYLLLGFKFFQLLYNPLASTLVILEKQHFILILVTVSLVFRFFIMLIFNETVFELLTAFVISSAFFYVLYNLVIFTMVKKQKPSIKP
ncbi:lipopolysaccharide biosynthesis protein [Aliiglaciecola litoralis]|uniref:lipopolysaccharide biosynthesis protein n=1 Tax=Aliiglaciecola litoralis TaxID=582857 RepID=UPI0031E3D77A